MAKIRTHYICQECGAASPQFFGKCPSCHTWNSLVEQVVPNTPATTDGARLAQRHRQQRNASPQALSSLTLTQISEQPIQRFSSGYVAD